jgi:hypothetical protein
MTADDQDPSSLASRILRRVDELIQEADRQTRPLEIDPYHAQLFELFVTADGAGYTREDAEEDLTPDGLCRALSARWGLTDAARDAVTRQTGLAPEHLARMRLLWSVMRMWMEWTYAWRRWEEFHRPLPEASE